MGSLGAVMWMNTSESYRPFSVVGGVVVDLTVALIVTHVVAMVLCTLAMASGNGWVLEEMVFVPSSIPSGHVWDLFLYPFRHNIVSESIWFAVDMLMLYWFGKRVEQAIGTFNFGVLYTLLVFVPPVVLFPVGLLMGGWGYSLAGSGVVHFSVFLASAALFPNLPLLFGILAKWAAMVLFAIYALMFVAQGYWAGLVELLVSAGVAVGGLQLLGHGSLYEQVKDWQTERAGQAMAQKKQRLRKAEEEFNTSVDEILDKISRKGIGSLTESEKKQLEAARAKLLDKDKR